MPNYDYKCQNCEEVFEIFQKITEPPLRECPVCGEPLVRLISGGAGIIFKGNGFYTTDYKKTHSKSFSSSESENKEKDKDLKKTETSSSSLKKN